MVGAGFYVARLTTKTCLPSVGICRQIQLRKLKTPGGILVFRVLVQVWGNSDSGKSDWGDSDCQENYSGKSNWGKSDSGKRDSGDNDSGKSDLGDGDSQEKVRQEMAIGRK